MLGALAGSAALADVKAGVDAWAAGNYDAAVREWRPPADAGDPDAQFNLAQAYKLGRGVPRDLTRAEDLYARAAAQGHMQAADNYGLLLFQRGEKERAMPYIRSAAARGDTRAEYILGLALFNGDGMERDWIRAYAYVSLAQQGGLPQAAGALTQMDQHIPMADRQKAVAVAAQLAADADATRERQVAAIDLGGMPGRPTPGRPAARPATAPSPLPEREPSSATVERAVADAARASGEAARAPVPPRARPAPPAARPAVVAQTQPAPPPPARRPAPPAAPAATGGWRVQLGAFGVRGNADALWQRVRARPELAGHGKQLVTAGPLTKLQVGGFPSESAAGAACARLKAGGFACIPTRE